MLMRWVCRRVDVARGPGAAACAGTHVRKRHLPRRIRLTPVPRHLSKFEFEFRLTPLTFQGAHAAHQIGQRLFGRINHTFQTKTKFDAPMASATRQTLRALGTATVPAFESRTHTRTIHATAVMIAHSSGTRHTLTRAPREHLSVIFAAAS